MSASIYLLADEFVRDKAKNKTDGKSEREECACVHCIRTFFIPMEVFTVEEQGDNSHMSAQCVFRKGKYFIQNLQDYGSAYGLCDCGGKSEESMNVNNTYRTLDTEEIMYT